MTKLAAAASYYLSSPNFSGGGGRKSCGKVNIPRRKSCSFSPARIAFPVALSFHTAASPTYCHCRVSMPLPLAFLIASCFSGKVSGKVKLHSVAGKVSPLCSPYSCSLPFI